MSYKIKNKHLDLLAAYNRNDQPSKMSHALKLCIAPTVLILMFAGIFCIITFMNMNKQKEIDAINEEIEIVQLKIDATDQEAYSELSQMEAALTSIESLNQSLSSLPELTKQKIMYLKNDLINGISIKTISFSQVSNNLSVSLTSTNVQNIEKYITRLKKHPQYVSIDYTGYQENASSQIIDTGALDENGLPIMSETTSSVYTFQLKITLEGKAGE